MVYNLYSEERRMLLQSVDRLLCWETVHEQTIGFADFGQNQLFLAFHRPPLQQQQCNKQPLVYTTRR